MDLLLLGCDPKREQSEVVTPIIWGIYFIELTNLALNICIPCICPIV